MKKTISLILCIALLFSLAACGSKAKLTQSQIEIDFLTSGYSNINSYTVNALEVKDQKEDDDTLTVTVTADLSNYYSEALIACDMIYVKENGAYVFSECVANTDYESEVTLTADTLTNNDIAVMAVGYSDYRSSNGSAVYPDMYVAPNANTYSGYDNIANTDDITVLDYRSDLEQKLAYATVEMRSAGLYFSINQTVNFCYYFDIDALAWRVQYADVTSSSVTALGSVRLATTAMIGTGEYNIVYTGVNPDGTLKGTVDGSDISSSQFAPSRLYGPNLITRPHGSGQVWYYLIAENELTSMYTRTGTVEISPVLNLNEAEDAE